MLSQNLLAGANGASALSLSSPPVTLSISAEDKSEQKAKSCESCERSSAFAPSKPWQSTNARTVPSSSPSSADADSHKPAVLSCVPTLLSGFCKASKSMLLPVRRNPQTDATATRRAPSLSRAAAPSGQTSYRQPPMLPAPFRIASSWTGFCKPCSGFKRPVPLPAEVTPPNQLPDPAPRGLHEAIAVPTLSMTPPFERAGLASDVVEPVLRILSAVTAGLQSRS
mmetsp:Transcript_107897/g.344385  ORF Transcript_107897/g.344385 Transcript_107897/m.344385 type:complete len:225 (-) Transcript_107897:1389-2063(-)